MNLKQQPYKQKLDLEKKFEYEFSLSAWSPDYPDPMTYIDMFVTGAHLMKWTILIRSMMS